MLQSDNAVSTAYDTFSPCWMLNKEYPVGIKFIQDGSPWYEYIWVFLFAIVGILVGIWLFGIDKDMTKDH